MVHTSCSQNLLKEYSVHHTPGMYVVVHEDLPIKNGLLHTIDHVPDIKYCTKRRKISNTERNQVATVTDIQITVAPPFKTAKQLTVAHFQGKCHG